MAGEYGAPSGPGIKEILAAANLVVAVVIVFVAARKGVIESVKLRAQKIAKDLIEAKEELLRIRAASQKAREELGNLDQTRKRFVDEVRAEGERMYSQIVEEARSTADKILADAKLAAENEMASAAAQLQALILEKTVAQAEALVRTEAGGDPQLQKKLHDKLFERLKQDLSSRPAEGRA
jgi:F0F1-type ATP synthase membrane subunit b/b'